MTFSISGFLNTRCTFHRMKDAKILHGWVEAFDEREIAVRLPANQDIQEGEKFYFQVFGLEEDAIFLAQLTTRLGAGLASVEIERKTAALCIFTIEGPIRTKRSEGNSRLANQGMVATVYKNGECLTPHPCEVLDISPKGLAVPLKIILEKGDEIVLNVATVLGQVEMQAMVMNVRQIDDEFFRHGLKILSLHRIDALRWNRIFKQSNL